MLPEQQKRILGYFIEEAKEHLETIEHSLLNLQAVVDDSEMLNEVFRAAHSVKGGAAMLGIYSIQHTAHKLEDYFKVLKENPIKVDQKLESLFFKGFDTLNELLEELQSPFGLADEVADNALKKVEPVFTDLQEHLSRLTHPAVGDEAADQLAAAAQSGEALRIVLQTELPNRLREMLQLFKREDTAANRQQLETICQTLSYLGEQFELPTWSNLLEVCRQAIVERGNSFAVLAPILIKEIKTAQDLILTGRSAEIHPRSQLTALVPNLNPEPARMSDLATSDTTVSPARQDALVNLFSQDEFLAPEPEIDLVSLFDDASSIADESAAPLVASESLESLDTLLEGETGGLEELFADLATANAQSEPTRTELVEEFLPEEDFWEQQQETLSADSAGVSAGDVASLESLLDEAPALADLTPAAEMELEATSEDELADELTSSPQMPVSRNDGFEDLEKLLEDAPKPPSRPAATPARSRPGRRKVAAGFEQTMKVPVKHLDSLSNLVGELVVNRNSLEDGQDKLRQFLDNLLYQVQQLSDVGQQMQDLYERSLLESSLLAIPASRMNSIGAVPSAGSGHATGANFDALEMDRFTGFHTLSQEVIERIVRVREAASDIEFVVDETEQVARMFRQVTTQVQEGLSRSRMMPFAQIADRLPRAVRDLSLKCNKQAKLEIEGRDTLVDKGILERLYDPMTHLVNNAIYHGIETPEVRKALGKPPEGNIKIRAFYQGSQTIISIADDGAGIDPEKVKAKAIALGLITPAEAETMSRQDVYSLLFYSGFSTQDRADELAGRGVGMDVVRTSLEEIRGAINTDSSVGKGTTFTIRLPLTLSITKALCCINNHSRIAFPIDGVEDMVDVSQDRIQQGDSGQFLPWRDRLLHFHRLSELLPYHRQMSRGNVYGSPHEENVISVVVLRSGDDLVAIQVDQVMGEQEIVIKQLSGPVPKPVGITGVTVQGDGRVMPIADVLELIDLSLNRLEVNRSLWGTMMPAEPPEERTEPLVLIVDDSITVRELLSLTFNKIGFRVEQARDGQEAWDKLRAGLPCDLVFCDIEMPRMDGLELLSRIQQDPELNHLPIAMLTSRGADRHRQMAVQLGAKAYFTKPYLEESLLDAAKRLLKGEVLVSPSSK